ncbi:MAG: class I tRNA ligase family protein [Candidatus Falkowbacteria bacterium]|nr:class I tRNA ligase family protein [Candidatus Falkowbacteria bacterium]
MIYDPKTIEEKWRSIWRDENLYETKDDFKREKYYVLDMFPYPSGDGLHVGHPKGYIATDIMARQKMMEGKNVLHPMGWDAFGLPAENYAIKNKIHPDAAVKKNIIRFKEQLEKIGFTYDWSREVKTTDPSYYKWTQWTFIQMFKKGLAYESFEPINWCPSCKTGLANEDLEDGHCERCGTLVEKKPMRQWVLKITDYAERLLDDLEKLDWPESIKESQRNWIGRSVGAEISFPVRTTDSTDETDGAPDSSDVIKVFTTRPDTLFGVTYLVLAPENDLINKLESKVSNFSEVKKYIEAAAKKTEIDRTAEGREKTGVELKGLTVINPATKEEVAVWVADYVLNDYGTGAVMAVPAHDERDYQFAKKYNLEIKQVIGPYCASTMSPVREGIKIVPRKMINCILRNPKTDEYACLKWREDFGWTTLIGGGIEADEDVVTAGLREIREESGYLNVKFVKSFGTCFGGGYATHKKENRFSSNVGLLFDLVTDKKEEVAEKEQANHKIKWLKRDEVATFLNVESSIYLWELFLSNENLYTGEGYLLASSKYDDLTTAEARTKITKDLGKAVIRYKLRDWVFSRQRYWGEPIPIIHCEKCGAVPVPEKDLPVALPEVEFYEPSGTGESPLANITDWVNVKCPKCGQDGKRETNTMPQWAGSSWYYLRYIDPNNNEALVDKKKEKYWSPVDMYVGGAEHATRHLIYARFWHKFLYDIEAVSHDEPFKRYTNLGLILAADGRKMSKRWGNVINPDDIIAKYGADAFRVYEMFLSPFTQSASFLESGVAAAKSFLNRVFILKDKIADNAELNNETITLLNQTIKKVGDDINNFKFNTAVSALMILSNALADCESIDVKSYSILLQLLAPLAPHITEELWQSHGNKESIFKSSWPKYDEKLLVSELTTIVVQVNGKMRDTFEISSSSSEEEIKQTALDRPSTQKWIEQKEIKKIIIVKGKVINIVI